MKELLPVGSIVESNKKFLMILGYYPNTFNEEEDYDYVCCQRKGLRRNHESIKLNRDYYYLSKNDIEKVYFIGFNDNSFDLFNFVSNKYMKKIRKLKKSKTKISDIELNAYFEKEFEKIKMGGKNEK